MQPTSLRSEPAVLRDGGSILVRPLSADDRHGLIELFGRLDALAIRHRFFGAKRLLSADDLARMTTETGDHWALGAILRDREGEHIVGVGELSRLPPAGGREE